MKPVSTDGEREVRAPSACCLSLSPPRLSPSWKRVQIYNGGSLGNRAHGAPKHLAGARCRERWWRSGTVGVGGDSGVKVLAWGLCRVTDGQVDLPRDPGLDQGVKRHRGAENRS